MNSSNSFNICPRCGNSNSLNAKYCSRCGAQLKVPTEAVVCHKCHTRNYSLANFCRNCGATLKVGAQTKICPRCGREIGAEENMCACGYSFVTMQQTQPRKVDVTSTNKDKKRDKKRNKNRQEDNYPQQSYAQQGQAEQQSANGGKKPKKSGRGFALFAFLFLALFVYVIIAPATARPGFLTNFDKGFYHHNKTENPDGPSAVLGESSNLYAEGDEGTATPEETWTVTFKNGDATVATVTVVKGQKLTAEQIPAAPTAPEGKEFKGWFAGDTAITAETDITGDITVTAGFADVAVTEPDPNAPQDYVYGWELIGDIIKLFDEEHRAAMDAFEGGAFAYILDQLGTATFVMVAMFAIFVLTAFFHLIVCLFRIISPRRSKHGNLLYLILFIVTAVLTALMLCSHMLPGEGNFFASVREFFTPKHNGIACSYGYALIFIPAYYLFFWIYSNMAKKKGAKKSKKDNGK